MPLVLLVALVLAAAVAIACASGPAGSSIARGSRPASTGPTGSPVDWQARYEAERARSRRRLAGWHRMEVARNDARARLRYVLKQHGTGIPWLDDALCIHSFESVNWFLDGHHDGGMQFNPGTWHRAGGTGYAFQANPIEQLYRAFVIWRSDGGSWREWSTRRYCGV